jgi:hypothetical protein
VPAGGGPVGGFIEKVAKKLDIDIKAATKLVNKWASKNGAITEDNAQQAFNQITANPFVEPANKGDGNGGDSSTSSSGGSSGGSSGATGPSPQDLRNTEASYLNVLIGWGIPITPQIKQFVAGVVRQGVGSSAFLAEVRTKKWYAQRFPGIMKPNGTMRMTEAQYISGYNAARDYAASVGRNLNPQAYGLAVKNGNSPSEIKAKLEALDSLKTNRDVLANFNEYEIATGRIKQPLTKQEMLQFIMRQGPVEFEQDWNTASQSAQLAKLGVDVGKPKTGSDLSYKELKNLQGNLAPGEEPDYAALAEGLKALPASALYGYGLNRKDIAKLAYKAPGYQQIAEVATRALTQYRVAVTEALTPGANPTAPQRVQASE